MLSYFKYRNSWALLKYLKETSVFVFVKLEIELSEANHRICMYKDGWTCYDRTLFTAILHSALNYVEHTVMKQNIMYCNITLLNHSLLIFAYIHSLYGYPKEVGGPWLVQWSYDTINDPSFFSLSASSTLVGDFLLKVFLGSQYGH